MRHRIGTFIVDEMGVTAIEYGLIADLVSLMIIGVVAQTGERLRNSLNAVAASL